MSAVAAVLGAFSRHRTAGDLLMLGMLLAGLYAAFSLRLQYFPDFERQQVLVDVEWRGAGPAEVDRQITAALEPALRAVEGVEDVRGRSREGRAALRVFFAPGWDMTRAVDDVSAAALAVEGLPEDAEPPDVRRSTWREPVTVVVVSGPVAHQQLTRIAQELQSRAFLSGVTITELEGGHAPEIRVTAPERALVERDLDLADVAAAVAAGAQPLPAGELAAGERVRAGAERRSPEAIAALPVRVGGGGERLLVRDIATVASREPDAQPRYYVGADRAVRLTVSRDRQGDAVRIHRMVERIAAEMRPELPAGVAIALTRNTANRISDRLMLLVDNAVVGFGLVLALLFLFLSARTAFWVAAGIPAALAAALGLMLAFGVTLNMISLFALIICLGIVVDDAIVVGEHADHLARRGVPPALAAEQAAARMLPAVFASAVTTVIAFAALLVLGGRFGALIAAIPLTVSMVLIASLAECFLVLPGHMRRALAAQQARAWWDAPSRVVDAGFSRFRERVFKPAVRVAVAWRYVTLACVAGLAMASAALFVGGEVRWRFFDGPEQAQATYNFAMRPDATIDDAAAMLAELRRALDAASARMEREHGVDPVLSALGAVGGSPGRALAGDEARDPEHLGGISVELVDADARPFPVSAFLRAWEAEVRPHPRLDLLAFREERSGPEADGVSVDLIGADAATLKSAALALQAELARLPAVAGLSDSLPYAADELTLTLTPLGDALGFSADALGRTLRDRLSGVEAARFPVDDRTVAVVVSLPEAELTQDYLTRARVRAPGGAWASLGDVATVSREGGFTVIERRNGYSYVSVTGALDAADADAAAAAEEALRTRLAPMIAEAFDVQVRFSGLSEDEDRFLSEAALAFMLCLAGIYGVLAWLLASWTRPLVVLTAAPLGMIGVIWGHHWMGVSLSMFSVVGVLGMTGIIVNDSIVLVRAVDEHAARRALAPAIVEAAADRLRAVFLTTVTTVAGLAPLLFETSAQARLLLPTVVTLVFGLGFGFVLVLVVTPALLAAHRDVAGALAALRRAPRALARLRRGRLRGAD